jgi:hypothetical protein
MVGIKISSYQSEFRNFWQWAALVLCYWVEFKISEIIFAERFIIFGIRQHQAWGTSVATLI